MLDLDELEELAPAPRRFDIIIYGATGFTGCLMVEHLDGLLSVPGAEQHKWAIAGRSQEKLDKIAAKCRTSPGIVLASTPEQITEMASDCRVLVSAAGPYLLCGEAIVKACVEQATHYVDVTGEVIWMHRMIQSYHEAALEKGILIVHCAGAMSAPDDICGYLLATKLGPMQQFREYSFGAGMQSGGSFSTGLAVVDHLVPDTMAVYSDPFSLGGKRSCGKRKEDEDCREAEADVLFPQLWLTPAYTAHTSARILRRSCGLFEGSLSGGVTYGDAVSFTIRDVVLDEKTATRAALLQNPVPFEIKEVVRQTRTLEEMRSRGLAATPGLGPQASLRAAGGRMEGFAVAQAESGEWAHIHYSGPEGYEVTAMTSIAAALVLAEELCSLKPREQGGVLTPAFALHGTTWIQRVQDTGFAGKSGTKLVFDQREGVPAQEEVLQALVAVYDKRKAASDMISSGAAKAWSVPSLLK